MCWRRGPCANSCFYITKFKYHLCYYLNLFAILAKGTVRWNVNMPYRPYWKDSNKVQILTYRSNCRIKHSESPLYMQPPSIWKFEKYLFTMSALHTKPRFAIERWGRISEIIVSLSSTLYIWEFLFVCGKTKITKYSHFNKSQLV